jgi:hypothetical protein
MPQMNVTGLKDARKDKWAPEYGRGKGFEIYQIILGVVVFAAASLILWVPFTFAGLGIAAFIGFAAAILPNEINTHHQDPKEYLQGEVKKKLNRSLLINDKRVAEPRVMRERYDVEITEPPLKREK